MSYRVVWRRRLKQQLHVLAFLARERGDLSDRIPRAAAEIDRRLAVDPAHEGESRDEDERVLIVSPLTAVYEVFEAEQVVLIYNFICYPRQRA